MDASGPSAAAAVQEAFTEYDFGEDEDETPPKGRKKGAMTATAEDLPLGEQSGGLGFCGRSIRGVSHDDSCLSRQTCC